MIKTQETKNKYATVKIKHLLSGQNINPVMPQLNLSRAFLAQI